MLKIFACYANQVSVHPPLSAMRIGATLLMILTGKQWSEGGLIAFGSAEYWIRVKSHPVLGDG